MIDEQILKGIKGKAIADIFIIQSEGWIKIVFDDETFILIDIDANLDPPEIEFSYHQITILEEG